MTVGTGGTDLFPNGPSSKFSKVEISSNMAMVRKNIPCMAAGKILNGENEARGTEGEDRDRWIVIN